MDKQGKKEEYRLKSHEKLEYIYSPGILDIIEEINQNAYGPPKTASKPPPRDFMKENVKLLKQMQIKNKEERPCRFPPLRPPNRFSHIKPKIYEPTHSCVLKKTARVEVIGSNTSSSLNAAPTQQRDSPIFNVKESQPCSPSCCMSKASSSSHINIEKDDQVKYSNRKLRCSSCLQHNRTNFNKPFTPHPLGYLPPYIAEEKQKREEIMRLQKEEEEKAAIPPGHVLLSDEDRLQTLELLIENHEELMLALQRLPICCDTLKVRKYKEELEKKIAKIEEGIKIFTRPKVFVQTDF